MDFTSVETRPTTLDTLPSELKVAIFKFLPDVASLFSLLLTSTSWYLTYMRVATSIMNTVLWNEIPTDIAIDIFAVKMSWGLPHSEDTRSVYKFLRSYSPNSEHSRSVKMFPDVSPWTLPELARMSDLHSHVHAFTLDFCAVVLSTQPILGEQRPSAMPPSYKERMRFYRAFYRFELYCNLVGGDRPTFKYAMTRQEQHVHFFHKFAPWELEHLMCVYEYLNRTLSDSFDRLVDHDVVWGELRLTKAGDIGTHKAGCLSLGLRYLRDVFAADTYEESIRLLDSGRNSNHEFLLPDARPPAVHPQQLFGTLGFSMEQWARARLGKEFGPYEAWKWAQYSDIPRPILTLYAFDREDLRGWGYCFWDHHRLNDWGLFSRSWSADGSRGITERKTTARLADRNNLRRSQRERSSIYHAGGRGWWKQGDESQIVWPDEDEDEEMQEENQDDNVWESALL